MVLERERPPFVQRLQGASIVARKTVPDRRTDGALHILVPDFGQPIGAADDDRQLVLSVPLPERRRHAARAANRRQFLIRHHHDAVDAFERIQDRRVGSRDVQNDVPVMLGGKLEHGTNPPDVERRHHHPLG